MAASKTHFMYNRWKKPHETQLNASPQMLVYSGQLAVAFPFNNRHSKPASIVPAQCQHMWLSSPWTLDFLSCKLAHRLFQPWETFEAILVSLCLFVSELRARTGRDERVIKTREFISLLLWLPRPVESHNGARGNILVGPPNIFMGPIWEEITRSRCPFKLCCYSHIGISICKCSYCQSSTFTVIHSNLENACHSEIQQETVNTKT